MSLSTICIIDVIIHDHDDQLKRTEYYDWHEASFGYTLPRFARVKALFLQLLRVESLKTHVEEVWCKEAELIQNHNSKRISQNVENTQACVKHFKDTTHNYGIWNGLQDQENQNKDPLDFHVRIFKLFTQ